jgi:hypothetical protein
MTVVLVPMPGAHSAIGGSEVADAVVESLDELTF